MGGDEFAACLVETDEEAGARLLERLSDRVDELVRRASCRPAARFTAGLRALPDEAADAEALFRLADAAALRGQARERSLKVRRQRRLDLDPLAA